MLRANASIRRLTLQYFVNRVSLASISLPSITSVGQIQLKIVSRRSNLISSLVVQSLGSTLYELQHGVYRVPYYNRVMIMMIEIEIDHYFNVPGLTPQTLFSRHALKYRESSLTWNLGLSSNHQSYGFFLSRKQRRKHLMDTGGELGSLKRLLLTPFDHI